MAIKKCVVVRLGVIYDSQTTNRMQGELPVRAHPPASIPIDHLEVIYDSKPARMHKNTITNSWKQLRFD